MPIVNEDIFKRDASPSKQGRFYNLVSVVYVL